MIKTKSRKILLLIPLFVICMGFLLFAINSNQANAIIENHWLYRLGSKSYNGSTVETWHDGTIATPLNVFLS